MAVSEPQAEVDPRAICALPMIGATTVEDVVFYAAVGGLAVVGWVSWPTAALFGGAHALHQRARNVIRKGALAQVRAGLLDAADAAV